MYLYNFIQLHNIHIGKQHGMIHKVHIFGSSLHYTLLAHPDHILSLLLLYATLSSSPNDYQMNQCRTHWHYGLKPPHLLLLLLLKKNHSSSFNCRQLESKDVKSYIYVLPDYSYIANN